MDPQQLGVCTVVDAGTTFVQAHILREEDVGTVMASGEHTSGGITEENLEVLNNIIAEEDINGVGGVGDEEEEDEVDNSDLDGDHDQSDATSTEQEKKKPLDYVSILCKCEVELFKAYDWCNNCSKRWEALELVYPDWSDTAFDCMLEWCDLSSDLREGRTVSTIRMDRLRELLQTIYREWEHEFHELINLYSQSRRMGARVTSLNTRPTLLSQPDLANLSAPES